MGKSIVSLEIRWFFDGTLPIKIREWFLSKQFGSNLMKEESREDIYFIIEERDDLGLKLSRGGLELKCRIGAEPFSDSELHINGLKENWSKNEWKYTEELSEQVKKSFIQNGLKGKRTYIVKTRFQRKYSVKNKTLTAIPVDVKLDKGCKIELTMLTRDNKPAWTIGFDTIGEPGEVNDILNTSINNLLFDYPDTNLEIANSYGYPRWVRLL